MEKKYNVLDQYEDFVAGPFTEEEAMVYCETNGGMFLIELVDDEEEGDLDN